MPNLKKVISLHQASLISGYHQDYLSSLIRKQEIKGEKIGRSWLTTEDEIENYVFKQKIRNKNWIIKNLMFFIKKINKSFMYAFICLILFSVGLYFYNQQNFSNKTQTQAKAQNTENSVLNKQMLIEDFNELKF